MKIIALLFTAVALVSCASDSGHHTSHRPDVIGRTPVPDDEMIDPDWIPGTPATPRAPGSRFADPGIARIFPADRSSFRDSGAPARHSDPIITRLGPPDRFTVPGTIPSLGEPPRERTPGSHFTNPRLGRSLDLGRSVMPSPVRISPPGSIIPSTPSPRPSDSTLSTVRRTPALRLDRSALSR
ncbi:MAG TPA: hypothetical protein VM511_05275 [Luteolibacter sp.]|nr:hypothetical protein [Luteolibacter sp.]